MSLPLTDQREARQVQLHHGQHRPRPIPARGPCGGGGSGRRGGTAAVSCGGSARRMVGVVHVRSMPYGRCKDDLSQTALSHSIARRGRRECCLTRAACTRKPSLSRKLCELLPPFLAPLIARCCVRGSRWVHVRRRPPPTLSVPRFFVFPLQVVCNVGIHKRAQA